MYDPIYETVSFFFWHKSAYFRHFTYINYAVKWLKCTTEFVNQDVSLTIRKKEKILAYIGKTAITPVPRLTRKKTAIWRGKYRINAVWYQIDLFKKRSGNILLVRSMPLRISSYIEKKPIKIESILLYLIGV